MAAIEKRDSQMADKNDNAMVGLQQSNVSDPTIVTSSISAPALTNLTIVYATDEPSITPDGSINIADGDAALNVLEIMTAIEELMTGINTLGTLTTELRVDHATFITEIASLETAVNAILDVLEEHGLMVAS